MPLGRQSLLGLVAHDILSARVLVISGILISPGKGGFDQAVAAVVHSDRETLIECTLLFSHFDWVYRGSLWKLSQSSNACALDHFFSFVNV